MPVTPGPTTAAMPTVAPEIRERFLIGQQDKFASLWNSSTKLFRSIADEAYRDEPENARKMFRDLQIRSWMAERLLPSTGLLSSIEAEDPKDEDQKHYVDKYTKILKATPRFSDLKMNQGFSLFFGKYGSQVRKTRKMIDGKTRVVIGDHQPWSGDKINWTWDSVPAVLVRTTWGDRGAQFLGLDDPQLEFPTPPDFRWADRAGGKYLVLGTPYYRDRWIIQRACPVDRDFLTESDMAGQAYGEGLRSLIYWPWYMREQLKVWALDAVQRMGVNGMLYAYCSSGNLADEEAIAKALADLVVNNIAVFKRIGGVDQDGIQNIPPSPVAYEVIRSFIDYFDSQIQLAIVGQQLSSGTEGSGLGGSGVADLHRSTKEALIRSDVVRLDETLTTDILHPLMRDNGDGNLPFQLRIKTQIDEQDGLEVMQKAQLAQAIGLALDEEDVRDKSGFKEPQDEAHTLKPPGTQVAMPGMPGGRGDQSDVDGTKPPKPVEHRIGHSENDYDAIGRRLGKRVHQANYAADEAVANYAAEDLPLTTCAADEPDTDDPGVMIALYPPEELADRLAIPGGNDPDDLHVTLAYLGKVSEVGRANLPKVERALKLAALQASPLVGWIGGIGRFPASISSDGMGVLYAGVDVPGLVELRQAILANLHGYGIDWKNNHGFTPHMTLDYVEPDAPLDLGKALESVPVAFRAVYLCYGEERIRIPLGMHARRTKDRLGRVRGASMALYAAETPVS